MARVQVEAVYAERNQLVAALCKLFPAMRYCDGVWTAVYVDLPTGQVSWHYGPRDAWLFAHLPVAPANPWDGHDTRTKYARLNALQVSDAASAP